MPKAKETTLMTRVLEDLDEMLPVTRTKLVERLKEGYSLEAREARVIENFAKLTPQGRKYVLATCMNGTT